MCRNSAGITEDLQVLLKMCRKSVGITENVHKICRYYTRSAGFKDDLQVLQKMCFLPLDEVTPSVRVKTQSTVKTPASVHLTDLDVLTNQALRITITDTIKFINTKA